MDGIIEQSNGFLPLAALRHAEPTAVGLWDLEDCSGVKWPLARAPERASDQIVLARLHSEPIAILHVQRSPGRDDLDALTAAVWRQARDELLGHIRSCACMPLPADAQELNAMLSSDQHRCPGQAPPRPAGHAAVIVCTVGGLRGLARSLDSLLGMRCDDFEIVVVDNNPSTEDTRRLVGGISSPVPVRYVAEPRRGLARARNAGVALAEEATYVAFTDDDVVVDEHWLARLLAPFARDDVRAVTGLVMPLSLESAAEKRFERYAGFGKGVRAETYSIRNPRDRFLYPYWGGMFGSGNSMAFRRDALLAIGGFDPALGAGTATAGGEDLAAFSDIVLAGGELVYEPRSVCWHEHRVEEQALRTQVRNYGIGLTAVLCRYLLRDRRRFSAAVLRSLPSIVRLARSRSDDRGSGRLPQDLARLEAFGRLLGPWRYARSLRDERGSARQPGGAETDRLRAAQPNAGQAGDQTLT